MQEIKMWMKKYLEFGLGTIFGAIVATVTTYVVFQIAGGDIDQARFLQIQECLVEKLEVTSE
jgi:high-affinity Fe2+/Pb2+ permease